MLLRHGHHAVLFVPALLFSMADSAVALGGGGVSGASSGYFYNGHGGNTKTSNIIAMVLIPFFLVLFCCLYARKRNRIRGFQKACQLAKEEVLADAKKAASSRPLIAFMHGHFTASYTETWGSTETAGLTTGGTMIFVEMTRRASDDNADFKCHSIAGNGSDADGAFTIVEGKLSRSGKVYWIQHGTKNKRAFKALVKGQFAWNATKDKLDFEGGFQCDNLSAGHFMLFRVYPKMEMDPDVI